MKFLRLILILSISAVLFAESGELNGPGLASRLAAKQEGSSYIRMRIASGNDVLQVQVKSRMSRSSAALVYQVLFPRERKGESVLLRRSGGMITGVSFTPPGPPQPISASRLGEGLFGSDIAYEDLIDNVYAWPQQSIVGNEDVGGTHCVILESKPGKGERSSYSSVRTWVDPRRFVPLRIEKYGSGGRLVRSITVTRIVPDGPDSIPANLSIRGARGGVTEIDGSRFRRGVAFEDSEFTEAGLQQITSPASR